MINALYSTTYVLRTGARSVRNHIAQVERKEEFLPSFEVEVESYQGKKR